MRTRTGAIIDSPKQVAGWLEYRPASAPGDSDGDGMPDERESKHHMNPNDPADANADCDGDGYRNIEEYLNDTDPAVTSG